MSKAVGVDVGTMFFQVAENDSDGKLSLKEIRNAFVREKPGYFIFREAQFADS